MSLMVWRSSGQALCKTPHNWNLWLAFFQRFICLSERVAERTHTHFPYVDSSLKRLQQPRLGSNQELGEARSQEFHLGPFIGGFRNPDVWVIFRSFPRHIRGGWIGSGVTRTGINAHIGCRRYMWHPYLLCHNAGSLFVCFSLDKTGLRNLVRKSQEVKCLFHT